MPEAINITSTINFDVVKIDTPLLSGVKTTHVYVNNRCKNSFTNLLDEWNKRGMINLILTFDGMYVPRFIRGSKSILSNHAWGTAFDINARWNPMGKPGVPLGQRGCVRELVTIANELGWYWGGHFKDRPDPMHFECVKPDA